MAQQEEFGPAIPIPLVIQPHERVEQLKQLLEQPDQQRQKINILALIQMYESGELGPLTTEQTIYICDGKVMEKPPSGQRLVPPGSVVWLEEIGMQMMQSHVQVASQMAQSGSSGFLAGTLMHEIFARFRLVNVYGGHANLTISRRIANDTGSSVQTIFVSDLVELQYNAQTYAGNLGVAFIGTASAPVLRQRIEIELQILNGQGETMTPWFPEVAVIVPDGPGLARLSGRAMRNHIYFATAPGNAML
ncbi:hypothetical protein CDV55_104354 [Aspergillus turcosus]|nr:hypothetical protein CDV55_104354 [Aspergillus turcosus]